jgi:hypothetical protein
MECNAADYNAPQICSKIGVLPKNRSAISGSDFFLEKNSF